MNFALIAPLLLTMVGVGVGVLMPRVMSPATAARAITAIVVGAGVAVAVPGRPGGVVIGAKLMEALDTDEQSALLAHEQAHLDLHHHRYVHTTGFIAAMIPPLAPLAHQVRFATERWADETAAAHIGSRTIVARAIARVALMSPQTSTHALAFIGTDTSTRVAALVKPQLKNRLTVAATISAAATAITLAGTFIEFHHLADFIAAACHP